MEPICVATWVDEFEFFKTKGDKSLFKNLRTHFKNCTENQIELLTQKGIYPYKFMNGFAGKFDYPGLPPKEFLYNDLAEEAVTDADYEHAQRVSHFS